MRILRKNIDQKIILNGKDSFKTDLGWQDNAQEMEKELLENIINPVQNFETVRYIHKPYTGSTGILQTDIWFKFWFISGGTYVQDYEPTGLSAKENAQMLKQTTESFFRLEFFKTPNGDTPNRLNRRLVFAKNLSLPLGEKYFYTTVNDYIFKPVFMGSNYRNKENMYLFWFQDDTALNEETLTGNTFYMTAKFFNAEDGSITDFTNKNFLTLSGPNLGQRVGTRENPILFYEKGISGSVQDVNEEYDMYYRVNIDREDVDYGYIYQVYYDGNPTITPTPTPTLTNTPTPSTTTNCGFSGGSATVVTLTPTPTPTITPTATNETCEITYSGGTSGYLQSYYFANPSPHTDTIVSGTITICDSTTFKLRINQFVNQGNIAQATLTIDGETIDVTVYDSQTITSSASITRSSGTYDYEVSCTNDLYGTQGAITYVQIITTV